MKLEAVLVRHRQLRNTYIVFSSDNGYHMGEHRLMPGKLTASDTDIRVPLVIAGPGIPAGSTTRFLYVEYRDGEREFYGLRKDPYEINNLARRLSRRQRRRLHRELMRPEPCHTGAGCWAAEHVPASA